MKEAGKVAAAILKKIKKLIAPGISTKDIECFFDNYLKNYPGMKAAFKGFKGYPSSLCVSVNEEIIHGIPSAKKIIKEGDVVSVDLGIEYEGLFVDTAYTYLVGRTSRKARRLVDTAWRALREGIRKIKVKAAVGDIGCAVQQTAEKRGFSVIRNFVGHGIGKKLHLAPEVPNFGRGGEGACLKEGIALAVEPMITAGSFEVDILDDGWTAKTRDDSLSAHFEHTVAVTKRGAWVLTQ